MRGAGSTGSPEANCPTSTHPRQTSSAPRSTAPTATGRCRRTDATDSVAIEQASCATAAPAASAAG